jgi:inositol-pentakisphosphate 2-kinase
VHPRLLQGKIAARSAYDPCDLFSGDPLRLRSALAALLEQPQNNLLLFRDAGKRELAGGQPARAAPQAAAAQHHVAGQGVLQPQQQEGGGAALEELVEGLLPLPASQRRSALVELLAAVLEMEGVLGRVLVAQQQCQHDVEGVYRLYCHLTGAAHAAAHANGSLGSDKQGSDAAALAACDDHAAAVRQLLLLPPEEAHAVLRSYVVATTAKDLAIMITLQQLAGVTEQLQQQRQDASGDLPLGHVYCSAARGWYAYRLTFVDLDLKPLAKIPQHYKLDREIVAAAQRLFTDGLGGSSGRTEHQHQHGVAQQQL